jgi:hypothetical protein
MFPCGPETSVLKVAGKRVEPELSCPWSLMTTAVSARHPQVAAFLESARGIAHEQNRVCRSDGGELSEDRLSQSDAPA